MEIKFLETYLAVVDAGSIAAAARILDVAPTTIAQQIKALEKEVGCPLLGRAGHTAKPTEAGYRILDRARLVVREAKDMCTVAASDALPAGPLRLGATYSALMGLLPPALRRWNQRYADIEIFIQPGDSVPLVQRVAEGDVDAAVIGDPLFPFPKSCDWALLREEPLVLVTPASMRVDDPLEVIAREPFIRFDRSFMVGKLVDIFLQQHGINPKAQFELDGTEVIAKFVAEGLGVSILPKCPQVVTQDAGTRHWPLPEPCPTRNVGLLWLRSSVRAPLSVALRDILLESP